MALAPPRRTLRAPTLMLQRQRAGRTPAFTTPVSSLPILPIYFYIARRSINNQNYLV